MENNSWIVLDEIADEIERAIGLLLNFVENNLFASSFSIGPICASIILQYSLTPQYSSLVLRKHRL